MSILGTDKHLKPFKSDGSAYVRRDHLPASVLHMPDAPQPLREIMRLEITSRAKGIFIEQLQKAMPPGKFSFA